MTGLVTKLWYHVAVPGESVETVAVLEVNLINRDGYPSPGGHLSLQGHVE